ncbi:MAG: DUF3068 domain-containing protein [Corynebacterium sp.]|uniref:DUF3068 domain-containing protein n=1 Tax=Corynebacterium sp. TaxID=1720 RepID=UPI003F95101E
MLPRSRVAAVLVLGLGCVLIAVGLALPALVPPERPVPLSLSESQLSLHDPEAEVGPSYLGEDADGPVTAPVTKTYAVTLGEPAEEDSASAQVGVTSLRDDVEDENAALLDAEVWSYRIDRMSGASLGEAKVADVPGTPAADSSVSGQWLSFPRDTEQQEYPVFDNLLRRDLPAHFVQTEDIGGTEVYVFRQDLEAEPVGQENPGYFRGSTSAGDDGGDAPLMRSGTREFRVEPSSGMIVSVSEDLRDFYAASGDAGGGDGADGEVELLSSFTGETPGEEREDLLSQATELGEDRPTRPWGIALTVTGAIVALGSAVVALRPQRAGRAQRPEA